MYLRDLTPLSDGVRQYIEKHLGDALSASKTYAACFRSPDAARPARLRREMIDDAGRFLDGSVRLTESLLEVTQGRGNITKGNLTFVGFQADFLLGEEVSQTHHFLAIMKLDVGDAFTTTFDPMTGIAEL